MATKEEINNQKDLNDEIKNEISLEQQILDLLSNRRGIDSNILSDQQDINNVLKDQVKNMDFEVVQRKQIKDLSAQVSAIASKSYSISKDQLGLTLTNVDITKNQEALSKNIILLEQQKQQLLTNINNGTASNAELNKDIVDSISDQVKAASKLKNDLDKVAKNSKEISDNFGVKAFGGMSEISKAIPGLSKFSGPFEQAGEASRSMAANIQEAAQSGGKGLTKEKIKQLGLDKKLGKLTGSAASNVMKGMSGGAKSMMALKAGAKALGPVLTKALGPVQLIIEAIKAFQLIDGKSGEIAKSMGVSAAEGRKMVSASADTAAMSGDLLTTTGDIINAQMKLNAVMGTSVSFPKEMALDFAQISERTGLSAEAMQHFAKFAIQGKGGIKEQLQDISDTTTELNSQFGVSLNMKDIQEGIGKLSASQRLSARGNTDELTKQVFLSKMLGLSASQLEGVQGSLLDFESSIGAEMEAELLTGKQLNLEGARAAALAGDQAALAAELAKEVGTEAEFMKMNVIKREAMAKAFGLNVDQMAEMLASQEAMDAMVEATGGKYKTQSEAQAAFNKLIEGGASAEAAAAEMKKQGIDDALASQMKSATNQDKMNAAMEKFSDLFVQLVDPLMPLIDALMAILDPVFAILSPIFKLIGDIVGLVMTVLMPAINAIQGMFKNLSTSFTNIFGGLGEVFEGIVNMDFSMILDGFKSIAKAAIGMITSPIQAVMDLIVGAVNLVIDGLNYVPGVDIPTLEPPSLMSMIGLAEGGIVTSPTMAMIGEGGESEAVIPLSKLADMLPKDIAIGDATIENAMGGIGSMFSSAKEGISNFFGGGDNKDADNEQLKSLNAKMSQLITLIERGGNVYIDGAKAGKSMVMATSNLG